MKLTQRLVVSAFGAIVAASASTLAYAEANQVTIGRALSIAYLPIIVMESRKLMEKHAKAAGLGDVKVDYKTMTGGTQINDALLSNSLQIATGGVAPFLVIWSKTHGQSNAVKGISPFNTTPLYLNTRKASIKSIKDFGPEDRIAIVTPKTALQAILLQMEAARVFGPESYAKLDPLTVGMPLADAAAQLIAGGGGHITADFTVPPFSYQELAVPGTRTVLSSLDVLGGPATYGISYSTTRFVTENPKLTAAFVSALREAIEFINADRPAAQAIFVASSTVKPSKEIMDRMISDPAITFGQTPQNMMKYADFMHRIGLLPVKAASWKDMFFPSEVTNLKGS